MEEKKKKIIRNIVIAVILVIFLFPIPCTMNDGGSVEYNALLYSVTNYHRITLQDDVEGFTEGFRVEILGIKIFEKTEFVPQQAR